MDETSGLSKRQLNMLKRKRQSTSNQSTAQHPHRRGAEKPSLDEGSDAGIHQTDFKTPLDELSNNSQDDTRNDPSDSTCPAPNPTVQPLAIEEGKDYLLDDDANLPYRLVRNLGHGHSANVEMVEDVSTGSVYARKVFRLCGDRAERKRVFENEIKIIRRLSPHHHVIGVFATYVSKREVGLILSPVAQGDLESLLQDIRDTGSPSDDQARILKMSFGCLAMGLAFMHRQKVRHKDIKPRNILVHNDFMVYTDFGYSLDHALDDNSTTTGRPEIFTRKYCAPEVRDWDPRNSKTDIFSLGCVFFEVLQTIRNQNPSLPPLTCYHEAIEDIESYLVPGKSAPLYPVDDIICRMLSRQPTARPPAGYIATRLRLYQSDMFCSMCTQCQFSSWGIRNVKGGHQEMLEVEEILATWNDGLFTFYLVKWVNTPLHKCRWYPDFKLLDAGIVKAWDQKVAEMEPEAFEAHQRSNISQAKAAIIAEGGTLRQGDPWG